MLQASARRRRRRRASPACRISAWRCGRCPCPRQNPGTRRDRARRARSTFGCTMPQPRISIQSLPSPKRTSPGRERSHWMSTSRLGSVNGKKLGRKRILSCGTSKNALQNSSSTQRMLATLARLVDDQPFDLMEHRRCVASESMPVGLAGDDDADRRLLRLHGADLHRRGVGAQKLAAGRPSTPLQEERVVHLARRMAFGEVQRGEIVIVGLDIRTFGDRETHIAEDRGDLVDHLADRMDAAALGRRLPHRQRHIDLFGGEPRGDRGILQFGLARAERLGDAVLQAVDGRALGLPLLRRSSSPASSAARRPSPSCRARRRAPPRSPARRRAAAISASREFSSVSMFGSWSLRDPGR